MAWSPLAGGTMFSSTNSKLLDVLNKIGQGDASAAAVSWLLAHPAQIVPVMGTNSLERIKKLSKCFEIDMDRETWFEIYTSALGHEVA